MSKREIRFAIEVRAERDSPGRLTGTLMRYGERASDRPEVFREGSLEWPAGGVILNRQHARSSPIMRVIPKTDGAEVRIDSRIPDTVAGRDLASEIRSGLFHGLSVEFEALDEGFAGELREIRKARLLAAGVVDEPSYPAARVEVRKRSELEGRSDLWL